MFNEDFDDGDVEIDFDQSSTDELQQQHSVHIHHPDDQIGFIMRAIVNREYGLHNESHGLKKRKISDYNPIRFKHQIRDSLYLMKSMSQTYEMFEHIEPIYSVDFNHNGRYICSSGNDCKVAIWNWSDNNLDYIYDSGHLTGSVRCCRWSPDGDYITTCGDDGFVRCAIIDRSLTTQSRVTCYHDAIVNEFVHCDPCVILSAGQDGRIFQSDLRQRSSIELLRIRRRKDGIFRLRTIDCNRQIRPHLFAVAGHGSSVLVYDRRFISNSDRNHLPYCTYYLSFLALNEEDRSRFSVPCIRFSPNSDRLLCSASTGEVVIADITRESNFSRRSVLVGQGVKLFSEPTFKCCWFSNRLAFSTSNDGFLYAWDIYDGSMIFFKIGDEVGNINALSAHPIDPILATAGSNCSVKVWSPTLDDDSIDYDIELIREKIIGNFRARFISNTYHKTLKDVEEISYIMSIRNIFDDTSGSFWRSHHNDNDQ